MYYFDKDHRTKNIYLNHIHPSDPSFVSVVHLSVVANQTESATKFQKPLQRQSKLMWFAEAHSMNHHLFHLQAFDKLDRNYAEIRYCHQITNGLQEIQRQTAGNFAGSNFISQSEKILNHGEISILQQPELLAERNPNLGLEMTNFNEEDYPQAYHEHGFSDKMHKIKTGLGSIPFPAMVEYSFREKHVYTAVGQLLDQVRNHQSKLCIGVAALQLNLKKN